MNRKWIPLAVVAGLFMILGLMTCSRYNTLVSSNETVDNAWSEVNVQLQRRADLIPNYVETVKGYAAHEKEVFTAIANARAALAGARTPAEAGAANSALDSALSRLLVIVEAYPQLKADQNFIRLQDELAGTENRIAVARKRYNDVVREFNTSIKQFPNSLFAGVFGFSARDYFQADAGAKTVPDVKF